MQLSSASILVFADLTQSDFSSNDYDSMRPYETRVLNATSKSEIDHFWPTFACANLSDADFTNRLLIVVLSSKSTDQHIGFLRAFIRYTHLMPGWDFRGANLVGARLANAGVIAVIGDKDHIVEESSGRSDFWNHLTTHFGGVKFKRGLVELRPVFQDAKLPADIPDWFRELIDISRASETSDTKVTCR
jgi:uncharacterized protein YjbI with pentapeptide repeats